MVKITEIDHSHPLLEEYARKHNKRIECCHGQRIFHNPEEPRPPRGTQIYVGRIPHNVYENTLVPMFSQAGDIFEMRLMMEFSGFTRGFCFVTYYEEEAAQEAIRMFHMYMLNGNSICVYKSWDNVRLYFGGIPRTVERNEILEEFKKMFEGVVNAFCTPQDGFPNRGWAFIEFDNHICACNARKMAWPRNLHMWGQMLKVDWAKPKRMSALRVASTVLMYNIDRQMRLEEIYELTRGKIKNNSLMGIDHRENTTFAKLEFSSPANAKLACSLMNGLVVRGRSIRTELKQPLNSSARPVRRTDTMAEDPEEGSTSHFVEEPQQQQVPIMSDEMGSPPTPPLFISDPASAPAPPIVSEVPNASYVPPPLNAYYPTFNHNFGYTQAYSHVYPPVYYGTVPQWTPFYATEVVQCYAAVNVPIVDGCPDFGGLGGF